jgi:hypothetical protein
LQEKLSLQPFEEVDTPFKEVFMPGGKYFKKHTLSSAVKPNMAFSAYQMAESLSSLTL